MRGDEHLIVQPSQELNIAGREPPGQITCSAACQPLTYPFGWITAREDWHIVPARATRYCPASSRLGTCAVHPGVIGMAVVIVGILNEAGSGLLRVVKVLARQLDPAHH